MLIYVSIYTSMTARHNHAQTTLQAKQTTHRHTHF